MPGLKYCLALTFLLLAIQSGGGTAFAETLQLAQLAPNEGELRSYEGLHAAAATGDVVAIKRLMLAGADLERRDSHGRTP